MIALALAALGLAAIAVGGCITFAVMNSRARDQRESARVLASSVGGELRGARDLIESLKRSLKSEQERADALDDELLQSHLAPDPVGARERMLKKWQTEHAAARGRAVSMPAPSTADTTDPDGLLDPNAE